MVNGGASAEQLREEVQHRQHVTFYTEPIHASICLS